MTLLGGGVVGKVVLIFRAILVVVATVVVVVGVTVDHVDTSRE